VTFEEFVAVQVRPMLRIARSMCGDRGLAEEMVQEVLVKAQLRWDRISRLDVPEAYVRRMLVNEYLSWRRKWSRVFPAGDLVDMADLETSSRVDPADQHADRDELRRQLARLPRQQRVVLALRYYADLSDAEIGKSMGCAEGTVRGYASRALATLRRAAIGELEDTERHTT
jgi:RNA polymerase sigma-70 factor (sigma-E family)